MNDKVQETIEFTSQLNREIVPLFSEHNQSLSPEEVNKYCKQLTFAFILVLILRRKGFPEAEVLISPANRNSENAFSNLMAPDLRDFDRVFDSTIFSGWINPQLQVPNQLMEIFFSCSESFPACTELETIGLVYERFACAQNIKKEGIFYTPLPVVRKIVQEALSSHLKKSVDTLDQITILDPACGSGIFLLEAYRFLSQIAEQENQPGRKQLLLNSLYGIDKDLTAVYITRLTLQLAFLESLSPGTARLADVPNLSGNICCGNTLLDPIDFDLDKAAEISLCSKLKAFSWTEHFPEIMNQGGFSCLVGNPPYGLSRDEQISKAENSRLKARYQAYRSGKPNKYLLFLAKGYELLKPGGILAFIVPNAWLGIRDGKALRSLLLKQQALDEIIVFDCPVFAEASVETVIVVVNKSCSSSQIRISRVNQISPLKINSEILIPVSTCLALPDQLIPTIWSDNCTRLFQHLSDCSLKLGCADSPFLPQIALQAYAQGKGSPPQTRSDVKNHVFHFENKTDDTCIPYLQGSDIQRYQVSWSGSFLKYGPWLAEPQSLERFTCARILLREIINSPPYLLNAVYTDQPFLYNKSVLHILPKADTNPDQLLALAGILNSVLGSFIIRFQGRKAQRKIFPKIVNADLKDFPLPNSFQHHFSSLATLVKNLLPTLTTDSSAIASTAEDAQRTLDAAVADLYGFNSVQLEDIYRTLR